MSILIKGMEMPKSCKECQVSFGYGNDVYCPFLFEPCDAVEDGLMWKECPKEGRLADCPLVEVKEPHGRLIDADALNIYDVSPIYEFCVMGVTEEDIGLAETIIEAEGSEDG